MKSAFSAELNIAESEYVRLSEFERFDDGSGCRATIKVAAGEFICTGKEFYFADPGKFLEELRKCYERLEGFAELKTQFEEEFLRLSFDGKGRVSITGLLRDYGGDDCYFRYSLGTDQTFIPGLIKSFEAVFSELHR